MMMMESVSLQEAFVKTIPGMERRMAEHQLIQHHQGSIMFQEHVSDPPISQEVPLLKGSFGHHISSGQNSVDSLYGRSSMANSDSVNSVIGLTSGSTVTIPVTSEVTTAHAVINHVHNLPATTPTGTFSPPPPPPAQIPTSSFGQPPPPVMDHHFHAQHFIPVTSAAAEVQNHATTLPRNLNSVNNTSTFNGRLAGTNGHNGYPESNGDDDEGGFIPFTELSPPRGSEMILSRKRNGDIPNSVASMATMPRNPHSEVMANGKKKKSVTIGTFTTVETFDNNFSSAV